MLFDPLLIAFFILAAGFVFQKKIGFDQQSAANLLIYVTGPALVFSSIFTKQIDLGEFATLWLAAILIMCASWIFAVFAFRALKYKNSGILLPAMFMNSGYLGYPVALFAFGEIGLQKAIIFDVMETILCFSIGAFLVQPHGAPIKEKLIGIAKLPLIYAIVLGIILNLAAAPVPSLLVQALALLGSATIPLALLTLGGRIATLKIGSLKVPAAALFARFVVGGIAGFAFVKILNLQGILASVVLLLSVMPPAVNSYLLNEKFNKDPQNSATAVALGTIVCIIPIAFVLSMI